MKLQVFRFLLRQAGILAISVAGALAAAAAPVAMVTDIEGQVQQATGEPATNPGLLAQITPGAEWVLADGAKLVVVYFTSGDEYTFTGPAVVKFHENAPELRSGGTVKSRSTVLAALGGQNRISTVGKVQAAVVMRGADEGAVLKLHNLNGTLTLDRHPEFRWEAIEPGLRYTFALSDETGKSLLEAEVEGTSLAVPSWLTLAEGGRYTWMVSARLGDGRKYSNVGEFAVADAALRQQVEAARPGEGATLSERVTFATWLDQVGLHDEARKLWKTLAAERLDSPALQQMARD